MISLFRYRHTGNIFSYDGYRNPVSRYRKKNTDEEYKLEIAMNQDGGGDYVAIDIEAVTYFGARHALDSLSQFWTFDEGVMDSDTGKFIVLKDVILIDKPEFQHRGIPRR